MSEREEVMVPAEGSAFTPLHVALERRQLIAQAVGILMERHGCNQTAALAELVALARTTNIDVGDLAEILVRAPPRH